MSDQVRRGLGRGLSALLGESFDLNKAAPVTPGPQAEPGAPAPVAGEAPVWSPAQTPLGATVTSFPPPRAQEPAEESAPQWTPPPELVEMANEQPIAGELGQRQVPVELIQRNPNQPRKAFDEADLLELADSIRAHGVLQPILVRPVAGQHGRYEIVAGERRWRAAQKAGVHAIPVVIRELDEIEVLEIGIVENVLRTDLNPLEEAMGYNQLIERFGRTQQDIADVVGKSRPHIANMLRLLNLPDEIQAFVRDGKLSAGHARALLTATDPLALAKRAVAEQLNVRDLEKLASAGKEERARPLRPSTDKAGKDADTRALEQRLSAALGLAVTINFKDGAGDVRIAYATLEQLDDIERRLLTPPQSYTPG
ncbi:MAG: ParB/RepB/Spo0J family partition protein [Hyphomonadaceae bacterium]